MTLSWLVHEHRANSANMADLPNARDRCDWQRGTSNESDEEFAIIRSGILKFLSVKTINNLSKNAI